MVEKFQDFFGYRSFEQGQDSRGLFQMPIAA
jgi:hypothetical protein